MANTEIVPHPRRRRPGGKKAAVGALVGTLATVCIPLALAQEAAPPAEGAAQKDVITEVVVVGSRIRRDVLNTTSSIQVVTADEAASAGFTSTAELLQGAGITNGGGQINNAFGGFVTNGGPGANPVSLRGLGEGRTLVLINGRRVAPAGAQGAVGSTDLNVLPSAIVQRVEVLRDGASSIYGSDAIAGVINVITDDRPQGLTFEGTVNRPTQGNGEQSRFSLVGGTSGDNWKVSGSLEVYDRKELTRANRDFTRCAADGTRDPETGESLDFIDPRTGQPKCYTVTGTGSQGATINTIGTQEINPTNAAAMGLNGAPVAAPGATSSRFTRFRPNASVTQGVLGFEGVGGPGNDINVRDTFEPRMLNESLLSPQRSYTGFVQGSYDLQSLGNAQAYFEGLVSQRRSTQTGYRQLTLDYRLGSPLIPDELAFSNFGPDQGTSDGERVGVRAFIGFGNDRSKQVVDFYKPSIGLRGDLAFIPDWRYDLNLTYARSKAEYDRESFLTDKLTFASDAVAAPAGTDPSLVRNGLTCRVNVSNPSERCVLYPMLNAATVGGDLPQDFQNYIFRNTTGHTTYKQTLVSAFADGPVFNLPAGEVKTVIGLEYRRDKIDDSPDINSVTGNLFNLTSATPTRGKDNVKDAYSEVEVPILNKLPFVNNLTFNGSFRYTDYDSYGSDTTYKYGAVYAPVKWIRLRGSKGTSFRAPALFEQFQGPASGFLASQGDPCNEYGNSSNPVLIANCSMELPGRPDFLATSGITTLNIGGAATGLEAETSTNVSYGLVIEPPLGEGFGSLSIGIDYFDIEINNGVDQAGATEILDRCYTDPDFATDSGFCRLVSRDPASGQLEVRDAFTNISTQISRGIDYSLRYERAIGPGRIRFNTLVTHYNSQAQGLFPGEALDQFNGSVADDIYPEWSGTAELNYSIGSWNIRYGVDWIDGLEGYKAAEEDPATSIFDLETDDYFEHFVSVRYINDAGGWEVIGGVRNLFNEQPGTISSGFFDRIGSSPLYSGYDFAGREAFLNLTKRF